VGREPVLDWADNTYSSIALYGRIGPVYEVEYATNIGPAAIWSPMTTLQLTNIMQLLAAPRLDSAGYYRAREITGGVLRIRQANESVFIEWLAGCQDCRLEESAAIGSGAAWNAVVADPQIANGTNRVELRMTNGSRFYRLGVVP
jgi:hypothetical protein